MNDYDSVCRKALRSARGAKGYLHDVAVQQPACHNTVLRHFSPPAQVPVLSGDLFFARSSALSAQSLNVLLRSRLIPLSEAIKIRWTKSLKAKYHEEFKSSNQWTWAKFWSNMLYLREDGDRTSSLYREAVERGFSMHGDSRRLYSAVHQHAQSWAPLVLRNGLENVCWNLLRKVFLCWDKMLHSPSIPTPCFIFTNSPQPPSAHFARTFSCNSYNL